MAKREKKRFRWIFPLFLVLYAAAFLWVTKNGLEWFWEYIDAYEQSRPYIALNAYEEDLTSEYIVGKCGALVDQIDHHVQSEESCRQVLLNELNGKLTCAKKSRESTEVKHVYAILCDKKVVGTMEMEQIGEPIMGFIPWVITKDSFDLSYLITEPVGITVPSDFPVYVNGNLLDSTYITVDNIQHPELEEFYETYPLPYMVTYQAGPFLGPSELTVTDPAGNPITEEDLVDMSVYIDNCTEAEIEAINTIANSFVNRYVAFTSRAGGDNAKNYYALAECMVPNGDLSKRMYAALDGLYWIADRGAVITDFDIHHYVNVGDGRYLCDLTYVVSMNTFSGLMETVNNIKIFFVETDKGLRAESMLSY